MIFDFHNETCSPFDDATPSKLSEIPTNSLNESNHSTSTTNLSIFSSYFLFVGVVVVVVFFRGAFAVCRFVA